MSDQDPLGGSPPAQHDHLILGGEEARMLPAFLGWNGPRTRDELRDVEGEIVVSDGRPAPGFEHLISSYTEQRAAIAVLRSGVEEGLLSEDYLWMSPRGVLSATGMEAGTAFHLGPWESSFRMLIDLLRLRPRPSPGPGFEPVRVPRTLLLAADDFSDGPDGPAQARGEIAQRVRSIAPEIADCLQIGDAELVTFVAEWDGVEGAQRSRLIYFDTPAGLLVHSEEAAFLRPSHRLEPAPTWLVWAQVVARLPQTDDLAHWRSSARSSTLNGSQS